MCGVPRQSQAKFEEEDEDEDEEKVSLFGRRREKISSSSFFLWGEREDPFALFVDFFEQKKRSSIKKKWKKNPDKEALRYGAPSPPRERLARVVVFALDDDSDDDASKGWRRAKTRSSASRDPGTTKL